MFSATQDKNLAHQTCHKHIDDKKAEATQLSLHFLNTVIHDQP